MRPVAEIALILALVFIVSACPKKPADHETAGTEPVTGEVRLKKNKKPSCPPDMVWVEKGGFCIDKYEYPNLAGELPLTGVTYDQAVELCKAYDKRLPTAEEWSTACGGLDGMDYPYGDEYKKDVCRADQAYSAGPVLSGVMEACESPYGAFDMTGNVWEWTRSDGFERGMKYVRGGSWLSYPSVATCNLEAWEKPDGGGADYGFRCALKP